MKQKIKDIIDEAIKNNCFNVYVHPKLEIDIYRTVGRYYLRWSPLPRARVYNDECLNLIMTYLAPLVVDDLFE